jgi:hypothetical protein
LYLESNKSEAKTVCSLLENIIVHLFKIKFGNDKTSHNRLYHEIRGYRKSIIRITDWDDVPSKSIINIVKERIQLSYQRALKDFIEVIEDDPKDYSVDSSYDFPQACPWTFEELMDNEIDSLVDRLV